MIFVLTLVAIVLAIIAGTIMLYASEGNNSFLCFFLGIVLISCAGGATICYAFTIWSYFAAEHKANIINREYGTNYTQEEVFFADSVIDTVRELDRKRVEINVWKLTATFLEINNFLDVVEPSSEGFSIQIN